MRLPLVLTFAGILCLGRVQAAPLIPDDVDPFIGTGKAGNCYPGAQAPFGMISWSPNTTFDDYESVPSRPGYKYDRDAIYGFTVTHLSGVGCHAAQDLPIMPVRGALDVSPVTHRNAYASRFSHARESARPGSYAVVLEEAGIDVALTVTERAGLGRFVFAPGAARSVLFRASQSVNGVTGSELEIDPVNGRVSGVIASGGFCDRNPELYGYRLYFVAEFDQPVAAHGFWKGENRLSADVGSATGADVAGFVTLGGDPAAPVRMRIGLSYVGTASALENLRAEIPGWDEDVVRIRTEAVWADLLGRMEIEAPAPVRRELATALYHNLLQPNLFDDVNGGYRGFDDRVHRVAPGRHKYVNFSNWDTYRTTAQLQGLLFPRQASDMAESLRLDAAQGAPAGVPIWGLFNHETYVMNGSSGIPWIANAFAFGARDYDHAAMRATLLDAVDRHYRDGETYYRLGYVAHMGKPWDFSVSQTLEYAIADFSLAQFCLLTGDPAGAARLSQRAQNAFNLMDPAARYLRPRRADGGWWPDFSPTSEEGFNEGNSAHYTWSIPHNIAGLVSALGGEAGAEARLDAFCSKVLVDGWNVGEPYFWISNEPCFGVPFVHHWLGKPWKTQDVLRRVAREFNATPDGLPGDDDVGAMSAYRLWIALGLYPAIPGTGGFVLTAPMVSQAVLHAGDGRTLTINAGGGEGGHDYIQSVALNGRPWTSSWLPLEELLTQQENTLVVRLGPEPPPTWGTARADRPPSFGTP